MKKNDVIALSKDIGVEYTDEQYRADLKLHCGADSSTKLTIEQLKVFTKYLEELKTELVKQKIAVDTSPESKAKRAAEYKAKQEEKKEAPGVMEQARLSMLRNQFEKGQPLFESEYREIGVDPSVVPPFLIKQIGE